MHAVYRSAAVRPLVRDTLHFVPSSCVSTFSEQKLHGCVFCVQFGNHVTQNQSPFIDRRPSKSVTTVRLRLYYTTVLNGLHQVVACLPFVEQRFAQRVSLRVAYIFQNKYCLFT